jgi:hypothetical protein
MRPFQTFSVKSVEILVARLQEINEARILDKTFIAQTGYGNVELPRFIRDLQQRIEDAKLINDIIVPETTLPCWAIAGEAFLVNTM